MSRALWDTIWSHDPALGTVGDWALQPLTTEEDVAAVTLDGDPPDEMTMAQAANSGGLQNVDPVGTAVLLCIASDARLPNWMLGRFGFTIADQQEWHGNTVGMAPGEEPLGSLLWVLRRAPLSNYTAKMAEHFCAEALQVLVRNGIINNVHVFAEVDKVMGMIAIHIRVFAKDWERNFVHDLYPLQ